MVMSPRAAELLWAVHETPGVTRAAAARAIGIGSGAATEVVAQLVADELVAERVAAPTGTRGRPSTVLVPHGSGPVVLAVSLTHETWHLHAVGLGGEVLAVAQDGHVGCDAPDVLVDVAAAVARMRRRFGRRVRGIAVAAPGTVTGTTLVHSTGRSWRELDLRAVWPRAAVFVAGNDATLAAAAESSRGAAVGADVALHIRVQAGIGGAVVDQGRVLTGAHGFGGEFGHLPLGEPGTPCACGASGCWGTAVDGDSLARALGRPAPRDPVSFTRRVIVSAAHDHAARDAVGRAVDALGRGVAGLVNAIDPDAVTIGGSGIDLMAADPERLARAYEGGLMRARRADRPALTAAALGEDGPVIGAAEQGWRAVWARL